MVVWGTVGGRGLLASRACGGRVAPRQHSFMRGGVVSQNVRNTRLAFRVGAIASAGRAEYKLAAKNGRGHMTRGAVTFLLRMKAAGGNGIVGRGTGAGAHIRPSRTNTMQIESSASQGRPEERETFPEEAQRQAETQRKCSSTRTSKMEQEGTHLHMDRQTESKTSARLTFQ